MGPFKTRRALLMALLAVVIIAMISFCLVPFDRWVDGFIAAVVDRRLEPYLEFYDLTDVARKAVRSNDPKLIHHGLPAAHRILDLAPRFVDDWNYGNAVHYGNLALGRYSLEAGDLAQARSRLLAAGRTPGSPQLDSFGPDMTLAEELLARGETPAVIEYFELCDRFWVGKNRSHLAEWRDAVSQGLTPRFGRWSAVPAGPRSQRLTDPGPPDRAASRL